MTEQSAPGVGQDLEVTLGSSGARYAFWRKVLVMRWVSAMALCLALALLPQFGPYRGVWAAVFAISSAVQNIVLGRVIKKTGKLPEAVAYSDYVYGVFVGIVLPEVFSWVMVILAATMALLVIGHPRRLSYRLVGIFAVPFFLVGFIQESPGWAPAFAIWLVTSVATIAIIGGVTDEERRLKDRYTELLEQLDVIVWESEGFRSPITYVNDRMESILGYGRAQWCAPGFWESIVDPADANVVEVSRREFEAGRSHALEYRVSTASGDEMWLLELIHISSDDRGAVTARGVMLDITARKHAERRVLQLGQFVEHIPLALQIMQIQDPTEPTSMRLIAANRAAAEQAGVTVEQLMSWRPASADEFVPDSDLIQAYMDVIKTGRSLDIDEYTYGDKFGDERRFRIQGVALPDNAIGLSIEDVTERAEAAAALRHQALHDPLTGLGNRALLTEQLETALENAKRNATDVALLLMDLDQFKEVNDALGHHHGDRLLVELARRLEETVRESDTIARLGGDEFAVVLTSDVSTDGALELAHRIADRFADPVDIDGVSLQSGVSIGVAVYPDDASNADSLLKRVDVAMYRAKNTGTSVAMYQADGDRSSARRLTLLAELRNAVETDELVMHYQPRIDLVTGAIMDVEALVRWNHPVHGLLPPSEFIELAEVSGVIQPLTEVVVRRACSDIAALCQSGFGLGVAVNLSVRNLYHHGLLAHIDSALTDSGLPASRLRVELTESQVMDDPAVAMEMLSQIRSAGIEISIDDFGTGYSSLSYLRNLPISEIKIDRTFVSDLEGGDSTLVHSIVDLGHNLGLQVVAEGVETGEVLRQLSDLRCDSAQGYFISRPVPLAELTKFLGEDQDRLSQWLPGVTPR